MKRFVGLSAIILLVAMIISSCSVYVPADRYDMSSYPPVMTVTDDIAAAEISVMGEWENTIESLIEQCKIQGSECDYETAKLNIIRYYHQKMTSEAASSISDQVRAKIISLNTIYTETLTSLISYLDGTAVSLESPSYDASTLTIDGSSQYAVYENGDTAAVYLMGHGHWVTGDMTEWFPLLNTKIVQIEFGVTTYIVERGQGSHEGLEDDDMFDVNINGLDPYRPFFEAAENAGITICLLISPHYFPTFLYNFYPDLPLGSFSGFIKYSVNHPVARRVVGVYLDCMLDDVTEYASVSSICLSNEPMYYPQSSEYDKLGWGQYLEDRFETIENFNTLCKTSYASFDVVPLSAGSGTTARTLAYYSYACDIFTGWHEWMADIVHEKTDLPVTAKVWGGVGRDCYSNGIDLVRFAEFSDIMGCDAYSEPGGNYHDNASTYHLWNKFMWYDLLRTLTGKPVYNMEDHITNCTSWFGNEKEINALATHIYSDMLGGAIHGRNGSMTWTWIDGHNPSADTYGSAVMRPLVIDRITKAALDTARLSNVIEAFVEDKPDAYILYSQTTLSYVTNFNAYSAAYRMAALNTGLNIAFVDETRLSTLPEDAVLIVAGSNFLPDDVFDCIKNKADEGKLILVGRCLKNDGYAIPRDKEMLNALYEKAYVFAGYDRIDRFIEDNVAREYLTDLCGVSISIKNYGKDISDVFHWRKVEYDGRIYIYAVLVGTTYNECGEYDDLRIYVDGVPVNDLRNELEGTDISHFSLKQFESAIISFPAK